MLEIRVSAFLENRGFLTGTNYGRGFHSNDLRGATISVDPSTGMPASKVPLLVRTSGYEVGLRKAGNNPPVDIEEIWRRIVFNILITNVDDHLNNHGFLHAGNGQWSLAPAFDLNPAPARQREFKTWMSADIGPRATIDNAMLALKPFGIANKRGLEILRDVENAASRWRKVALSPAVGMKAADANLFADAFEHAERIAARKALAAKIAVAGSLAASRSGIRKR